METELQRVESSRSHSMVKTSSYISMRDDPDIKYTSLKDVLSSLEDSPDAGNSSAIAYPNSIHDFNSSTISIKNQLVKHAASAYLQSAAIIATRDQHWFRRVWRQSRRQRVLDSRGQDCVDGPLGLCIGLMMRTLRRMLAPAATHNVVNRPCSSSVG